MAVSASAKRWTLRELHRLPDDGNKYELVRGELFVTPAPSRPHQLIIARLARILDPYVAREGLGIVHTARSIVRRRGSEVEPDLYVDSGEGTDWDSAPTPILVVEVHSRTTRKRDLVQKRAYYFEDAGVPEYWMIDAETRSVRVARAAGDDVIASDVLRWQPRGAVNMLEVEIARLFERL